MRGFESGKVGPVDQGDYVGGNYASALNLEAQLPNLLPEATQTDVAAFVDLVICGQLIMIVALEVQAK